MKTTHVTISSIIVLFSCFTSACISHITIKDEPRQSVRFSSPQAAQTFYDAYLSAISPKGRGSVSVYVALPYWHRTELTDNVHFNRAVQAADSNHNGIISGEETRTFAVQQRAVKTAPSEIPR